MSTEAGYELPLHYQNTLGLGNTQDLELSEQNDIAREHMLVRRAAGISDISHKGQVRV